MVAGKRHRKMLKQGVNGFKLDRSEVLVPETRDILVETDAPMYKIPVFIREVSTISLGNMKTLYNESLAITKNKPDLKKLEKEAFGEDL